MDQSKVEKAAALRGSTVEFVQGRGKSKQVVTGHDGENVTFGDGKKKHVDKVTKVA